MKGKVSVVAVVSNLIGKLAEPSDVLMQHCWPFARLEQTEAGHSQYVLSDRTAEIVAVFVGDLQEGGAVKFLLRGRTTQRLAEVHATHVKLSEEQPCAS